MALTLPVQSILTEDDTSATQVEPESIDSQTNTSGTVEPI